MPLIYVLFAVWTFQLRILGRCFAYKQLLHLWLSMCAMVKRPCQFGLISRHGLRLLNGRVFAAILRVPVKGTGALLGGPETEASFWPPTGEPLPEWPRNGMPSSWMQ